MSEKTRDFVIAILVLLMAVVSDANGECCGVADARDGGLAGAATGYVYTSPRSGLAQSAADLAPAPDAHMCSVSDTGGASHRQALELFSLSLRKT